MAKVTEAPKEHLLELKNRCEMSLTGVMEVVNFSDTLVNLRTSCGDLMVRGDGLSMGRLNTETGELYIKGTVSILRYSKAKGKNRFEGLLK